MGSSTRHLLPIQSSSRSHESITNNQSFIMKATIIATALAFSSVAVAAPGGDHGKKGWCKNGSYKKGDVKADYGNEWPKKEYFTSTYSVVATPDQVINTDQIPAPGEPGAVGYYNYGINSKDDVICYDIVLKGVTGFKVAQIEANPAGFFTDAHTTLYVPGVVRGQLG